MEIKMMVQTTPNPNALKFILNITVKNGGKVTYKDVKECQHNPMAAALLGVGHVSEVYFFDNYITVTQDGSAAWESIEEDIKKIILEYAKTHDPDFKVAEDKKVTAVASDNPEIARINAILDNTIRPALQMDGGDIQIMDFDGTNLTVNYQGACGSCPSASMGTLRAIEAILRDQYNPDIVVLNQQGGEGAYDNTY